MEQKQVVGQVDVDQMRWFAVGLLESEFDGSEGSLTGRMEEVREALREQFPGADEMQVSDVLWQSFFLLAETADQEELTDWSAA